MYFTLILGEFIVVVIELFIFIAFVTERPRMVTLGYVLTANLLSLVAGGLLVNALL